MNCKSIIATLFVVLVFRVIPTSAQTTAFTYQGKLTTSGAPATGNYDFEFRLFDALSGGLQQGTTQTLTNIVVTAGIFTVQLDFGSCASCFSGAARFLDVTVRPAGGGVFTQLAPRQPITSNPYALKTQNLMFNGPFNDGTTIFTASNTFAGEGAGLNTSSNSDPTNSLGKSNSFFGAGAGQANTLGAYNDFFGARAGQANTVGTRNAFFGGFAGNNNISGNDNAFFGMAAGLGNISGKLNTFIGRGADIGNPNGNYNTLLGAFTRTNAPINIGTAIGYRAEVTQSNSLILGSINGVNGCIPIIDGCDTVNVGIGTTAPSERLHVVGNGLFTGNLTVSGGTLNASVVNAATQYNIVSPALGSSIRLLGISGTDDTNTFLGRNAAAANPTGSFNSFFGNGAGQSTVAGGNNSFFGSGAGSANVSGTDNAFFGRNAGNANTASDNAFFGSFAGAANTNGFGNSFFGKEAGRNNTDGINNAFFGAEAGNANTTGESNTFFGFETGFKNTIGGLNAFFGVQAGAFNTTGGQNSFFGTLAGFSNTTGTDNALFGTGAGQSNTTGIGNAFFGSQAGNVNTTSNANTFIGLGANFTAANPTGDNNTLLGAIARVNSGISNGTAIGARALVTQSNSLVLGSINGVNSATADTRVGIGTTAPAFKLQVIDPSNTGLRVQTNTTGGTVASFGGAGAFQIDASGVAGGRLQVSENGNVGIGTNAPADKLEVNGILRLDGLGSSGGTQLCRNLSNQIANCSSSIRYKTNIATLHTGLSLINRLRPVTFDWKQGGQHDLGLVAEEVAKVEPLLVTHNDKGEIEGVKYDRVGVLLINAVKEQQQTITSLQKEKLEMQAHINQQNRRLESLQSQIEALQSVVCSQHPTAEICKPKN